MADRRYAGILAVLLLLAGGLALAVLPGPGGARVFGVSLLWWYCVVVAPLLALLAAIVVLPMTPACMTASVSPVLVATLLARRWGDVTASPRRPAWPVRVSWSGPASCSRVISPSRWGESGGTAWASPAPSVSWPAFAPPIVCGPGSSPWASSSSPLPSSS